MLSGVVVSDWRSLIRVTLNSLIPIRFLDRLFINFLLLINRYSDPCYSYIGAFFVGSFLLIIHLFLSHSLTL